MPFSQLQTHDLASWNELTDAYATALVAMERGDPSAREHVQRLYAQVKALLPAGLAQHPSMLAR